MLRKLLVVPLLAVSLAGCGSGDDTAVSTGNGVTSSASGAAATPSGSATPTACPTKATKSFAKTRFATDVGLAFGTFYQWIYKPFKAGSFTAESKKPSTYTKAIAAGAFSLNRFNAARKLVSADPTLCKYLKTPFDSVSNSVQSAVDGLKRGDPSGIAGAGTAIESARKAASDAGVKITDRSAPSF